jgi:hypothetical protein
MFTRAKRTSRSVDYLLAALSPLEVSKSTRAYFESLSPAEREALIARSTSRMDDDERAFLSIAGDFETFLEQNRRALRTLDHDALRAILLPVISARAASVDGTEDEGLRVPELSAQLRAALPPVSAAQAFRRLITPFNEFFARTRERLLVLDAKLLRYYKACWTSTVRACEALSSALAIIAGGLAIAVVLVGIVMPAGHAVLNWMLSPAPARLAASLQKPHAAPPGAKAVAYHPAAKKIVVAQHTAPPATPSPKPSPTPTAAPTKTPAPSATPAQTPTPQPVHVAAAKPKPAKPKVAHGIVATVPSHEAPLVQRARLIVMSYLDSLMRGDASSALGNLGLSASAGTSNLTEAPILAGATEFRIVRASLTEPGSAKVQVMIDSPQGRYFGDYIVSANGPAAWITQHEVIPVESTVARHN